MAVIDVRDVGSCAMRSDAVDWNLVWARTSDSLAEHIEAGFGHLLTEDSLRFATALALAAQGLAGSALTVEVPLVQLGGGKLDLAAQFDDGQAVFEFKYPRGARGPISPDTMILGEMLKDFYRLSKVVGTHRWVVQLVGPRLLGYLNRVQQRHPLTWVTAVGETFSCTGDVVMGLPATARTAMGLWPAEHAVDAECCFAGVLPDKSLLVVYRVIDIRSPHAIL